jgi:hypothetical protein
MLGIVGPGVSALGRGRAASARDRAARQRAFARLGTTGGWPRQESNLRTRIRRLRAESLFAGKRRSEGRVRATVRATPAPSARDRAFPRARAAPGYRQRGLVARDVMPARDRALPRPRPPRRRLAAGTVAPPSRLLTVLRRPSSRSTSGCQWSTWRARVMSGCRTCGSSIGRAAKTISLFEPVTRMTVSASSSRVISAGCRG